MTRERATLTSTAVTEGWRESLLAVAFGKGAQQVPRLPPDFLLVLVALASSMRLSLMKAAHVALSGVARQEIRVRSG
jgi:hypothetical protein